MSEQTQIVIYFQGPLRGKDRYAATNKFNGYENHLKISIYR